MSSNSFSERSSLVQDHSHKQRPAGQPEGSPGSIPYGATARSLGSPTADNATINPSSGPRPARAQSEVSVTSFGMFGVGGEGDPKDLQELLYNLDRATSLLRKHIREENVQDHV